MQMITNQDSLILKGTLLKCLLLLKHKPELRDTDFGICTNVDVLMETQFMDIISNSKHHLEFERLRNGVMADWPDTASTSLAYPVEGGRHDYRDNHEKWDATTEMGARRLALLDYMITTLQS